MGSEAEPGHIKRVLDEYDEWMRNAEANIKETRAKVIHHYMTCAVYDQPDTMTMTERHQHCTCGAQD